MDFQCGARIINGLLRSWWQLAAGRPRTNKKAGTRPAFSNEMMSGADQYFAMIGPPQR